MVCKSYSVSAPGSLMLLGEHAVLAHKSAVVYAVDKRINVSLTPNTSDKINIVDTKLGKLVVDLDNIYIQEPFSFVLSAILLFKSKLKTGFNLNISADFASNLGLGSSAAVTAATIAVLGSWLNSTPLVPRKIFLLAKKAVLRVQGLGSGADLAASIYGGLIHFRVKPLEIDPLPIIPKLTVVYCGYKTPTKEVIKIVNTYREKQPKLYADIFRAMHTCVEQAILAIKKRDWDSLGGLFMQHHALQSALGTSDQNLEFLVWALRKQTGILGSKISGSGLGDCVIGLGEIKHSILSQDQIKQFPGFLQFSISPSLQGLVYTNE